MRKILLIGIGTGNPDHMTIEAVEALKRADVFFIPDKGAEKSALRKLREDICRRFISDANYRTVDFDLPRRREAGDDYLGSVDDWHERIETIYADLLAQHLAENECGAFLVWGDPTLYDSTLRILDRLRTKGLALEYQIIPGISAVQALAARHGVALNTIGEPVLITTGRKIAEGFPDDLDSVVVMLDGDQAFKRPGMEDLHIYWGAYLGTKDEILVSGRLSDVRSEIETVRRAARERNGWIMDTYLLRKTGNV